MLESFYAQCGPLQSKAEIDPQSLAALKSVLPEELHSLLSQGKGSYMNGYLWIINPEEYKDIAEEIYSPVEQPSICFARDAFGGLFVWENGSIVYLNVRHGLSTVVGRKVSVFFNNILVDWDYISDQLHLENYQPAKEMIGDLNADECYGYVPLLSLGGSEKPENLQKVKLREHISIIAQAAGKVS
ncbi:T6SS immunity protein Tdi1 domain-containing protein [Chitinophaga niabensis]|uniref:T6SS immunity protein Tdi1 domain-containing protein n=1 Tax=Chitinophaga niabensis TaxID=536979 RepID=UPI0031BBC833